MPFFLARQTKENRADKAQSLKCLHACFLGCFQVRWNLNREGNFFDRFSKLLLENVRIERNHLTLKVKPEKQKLAYNRVYLCALSKGNFKGLLKGGPSKTWKFWGKFQGWPRVRPPKFSQKPSLSSMQTFRQIERKLLSASHEKWHSQMVIQRSQKRRLLKILFLYRSRQTKEVHQANCQQQRVARV